MLIARPDPGTHQPVGTPGLLEGRGVLTVAALSSNGGPITVMDASSRPVMNWNWGTWTASIDGATFGIPLDRGWLDAWLTARGLTRADLDFDGSKAMEQRFINDFGPIA